MGPPEGQAEDRAEGPERRGEGGPGEAVSSPSPAPPSPPLLSPRLIRFHTLNQDRGDFPNLRQQRAKPCGPGPNRAVVDVTVHSTQGLLCTGQHVCVCLWYMYAT